MIKKHLPGYGHCSKCRGAGKLVGLGNFKIDCDMCNATGWILLADEKMEDEILHQKKVDEVKPKRKYGKKEVK